MDSVLRNSFIKWEKRGVFGAFLGVFSFCRLWAMIMAKTIPCADVISRICLVCRFILWFYFECLKLLHEKHELIFSTEQILVKFKYKYDGMLCKPVFVWFWFQPIFKILTYKIKENLFIVRSTFRFKRSRQTHAPRNHVL